MRKFLRHECWHKWEVDNMRLGEHELPECGASKFDDGPETRIIKDEGCV